MNVRPSYPLPALLLWAAFLSIGLVLFCLPLTASAQWSTTVAILLITVLAWFAIRRKSATATHISNSGAVSIAPQLPVILVIGPHASALFAHSGQPSSIRQHADAIWLHVDNPAQLSQAIASLHATRQRYPQAALLPLMPDCGRDDAVLRGEFAQWQRALADITHHPDCTLPCYVAIYAQLAGQRGLYASTTATWLGETANPDDIQRGKRDLRRSMQAIRQRLERSTLSASRPLDAGRNTLGLALLDWLHDSALATTLTALTATAPLVPAGVMLADVALAPNRSGAWSRWLAARSGLQLPVGTTSAEALPLPAFLPSQSSEPAAPSASPWWRAACHALWLSLLALCLALLSSAWNNQQLIQRLTDNLERYWATSDAQSDAKRAAMRTLLQDRSALQEYAQLGVPVRLSWGLYRGTALLPVLDGAIASYRPPELTSVTLDSVLLFETGKTALRDGAAQALQQALMLIQRNQKKNVLIAGHTDNIGSPDSNVALSEARARAVRDWFVKKSDLPVTHFAIQGYGDSRPLVGNDREDGRARNRRVEISLIPDPGAH
ncbi:OmpA family protein [Paraherbaspirillum soli]|uniref:OmpA family protein n=1 Tax=Paraherbaspirillum soli TaxID=631222 RepID=A0ABW0M695_9BURK